MPRPLDNGRIRISARSKSSALDILKERYARSEINKEEFEKMKKDITG